MRSVVFEILAIVSVLLPSVTRGAQPSPISDGEDSQDSRKWRIEAKSLIFEANSINYDGKSKNAAERNFVGLEPEISYLKKRQTADHIGDDEWQSQGLHQEAASAPHSDRDSSKAPTAPYGAAMALILILLVIVIVAVIGISIYFVIQAINDRETVNLADAEVQFQSQVSLQEADEGEEVHTGDGGGSYRIVVDEDENAIMFSKWTGWIMEKLHVGQEQKVQQEDSRSLAEAPCPPPAPPRKTKSDWNVAGSPETATKQAANDKIVFVQNGVHQKIPKALKSAFERPERDKKPFSYFASGAAPDLTAKPSPKSVKQANLTLNGPQVPKVLPIVTDKDLKFEEEKSKSKMPAVTAMTNSSQYNTPIALYSKEVLQEEFSRRSAEPSSGGEATHTPNVHTHLKTSTYQTNESDVEDTPRYTGYVNPNSQSPCFKRLQYITGLTTDSEDERSIEIRPKDVSTGGDGGTRRTTADISRKFELHNGQENFGHSDKNILEQQMKAQEMYQNGYHHPMTNSYQEATYDESRCVEPSVEDSALLAKISEAEKPKVPTPVLPDWIKKAEIKHDKWRGYAEYQDTHKYEGPAVPTGHVASSSPGFWRRSTSQTPAMVKETPAARARSIEPSSRHAAYQHGNVYRTSKKESWMKPYVAPNVMEPNTLSKPLTIRTSTETPIQRYTPSFETTITKPQQATYEYAAKLTPGGYKPGQTPKWSSMSGSRPTGDRTTPGYVSRSPAPQYKIETTYLTPLPPTASFQPAPASYTSDRPPWTGERDDAAKKWHYEQEAGKRHQQMEEEMMHRRAVAGTQPAVSPRWKPVTAEERALVSLSEPAAANEAPTITKAWRDDTGASTKSQTTGSFVDQDGNVVSYVKEVYTTSDPGKEFSMLTQEEKKVLEEPLQPGVISRHTTTKYYKKSTYTSSTTTATSPSRPAVSTTPFGSIYTPTPGALSYINHPPRKFTTETQY